MALIYWIIIIFFVLALIALAVVAYRFRQHLQTGWFMLKTYRQFRKNAKPAKKVIENTAKSDAPLIKCAKCHKWVPQDQAVKLKANYFCSHNCLEESFTAKR